jgi:hypothetical protein
VRTRRVVVQPPGSLGGRQAVRANYQDSEAFTASGSQSTDSGGEGGRLPGSAQSDGSGPTASVAGDGDSACVGGLLTCA